MVTTGFDDKVSFIWAVADELRGEFKAHEYGQVILPFLVLRRLECALEPSKAAVIARAPSLRCRNRTQRAAVRPTRAGATDSTETRDRVEFLDIEYGTEF